jgi:8-oxo-dGTP pyrophosphatase MutT (NUDIX family)
MGGEGSARRVADIDWDAWVPDDVATLMFVIRGGEVLLIRKLRGLGRGKINAPGGRLEPGESPLEAAIRETREEVGVVPLAPRHRGELRFQFRPDGVTPEGAPKVGYRLACHVFTADGCEGEAIATDEAIPHWTPLSDLPFDAMWADDRIWLPPMLSGRTPFSGRFVFDGEAMLDHVLDARDPCTPIFEAFDRLGIRHATHAHPPVFTVAEAQAVRVAHPASREGLHAKNLFLRNKKGAMWLVTLEETTPVDLKALGAALGAGHLSFCSPARLREHLGVEPGSVTPLAALHDTEGQVSVALDARLAQAPRVWVHPMTNDRTTGLSGPDLVAFLAACGHPPRLFTP